MVQNYFIGQVNKSLVCTISLDICNPLEMWSCYPQHKWNWVVYKIHNVQSSPLPSPITCCCFWELLIYLKWKKWKITMETTENSLLLNNNKKKKVQLWSVSKRDFRKKTKITFAMGKLSFNALMNTDEDRLIYYSLREWNRFLW